MSQFKSGDYLHYSFRGQFYFTHYSQSSTNSHPFYVSHFASKVSKFAKQRESTLKSIIRYLEKSKCKIGRCPPFVFFASSLVLQISMVFHHKDCNWHLADKLTSFCILELAFLSFLLIHQSSMLTCNSRQPRKEGPNKHLPGIPDQPLCPFYWLIM